MIRNTFTTYEVSKFCGVTMVSVIGWIEQKKLIAYKTPGGHRRVKREDLISFLKSNKIPLPDELLEVGDVAVLIIDDDKNITESFKMIINKKFEDIQVYTANNGFEGGEMVVSINPDIIFLDIMLPGINGMEVCEIIRRYNKSCIIAAITSHPSDEIKEKMLSKGSNYFLRKPVKSDDIFNIINKKYKKIMKSRM